MCERNLTFNWSKVIVELLAALEILTSPGGYSEFINPQSYTLTSVLVSIRGFYSCPKATFSYNKKHSYILNFIVMPWLAGLHNFRLHPYARRQVHLWFAVIVLD